MKKEERIEKIKKVISLFIYDMFDDDLNIVYEEIDNCANEIDDAIEIDKYGVQTILAELNYDSDGIAVTSEAISTNKNIIKIKGTHEDK